MVVLLQVYNLVSWFFIFQNKFKKEERANSWRIDKAFSNFGKQFYQKHITILSHYRWDWGIKRIMVFSLFRGEA